MESGNGGASSEGVLIPVSDTSDAFKNSILTLLQSAHLYEESKQSFRYKSAVLIKNPQLEKKYDAFRAKKREVGYSEEDLQETYGFLLFDDASKAHALEETGVLSGNRTCTILGDPTKGVYISVYSDCLDLNRWYHGKSGYIAIIRLTKGRVKKVSENYTQNYTAPTGGFDCHVSEQLSSVSANTSSFLAFERTQYYVYELLDDGSNDTAQCPSAACPFAIVVFSYADTKAPIVAPQEKREEKKTVCHYMPWRGQLQIGSQIYNVGLRSTRRALSAGTLPPVVKVDKVISMLHLKQLLPRTVFETCFSGEVFLDGLYCSLCELVPSEAEDTHSLSLLVQEVKEKDLALPVSLNDGGFLILLHSSHFFTCDDTGSNATNVLQGLFVFQETRQIPRDTKCGERNVAMSAEILQVLPVLSYAEGEAEKTPIEPNEELCEVLVQHMQSYAALIIPGLALSPPRDVSIFPDQYDVPYAHRHLYLSPEWTNKAWQGFRSYLSKPLSFQLPVSKASQLLAAGQEERREDLDDDVYICLSSPEDVQTIPVSMESEDKFTVQESFVNRETSVDTCITSPESLIDVSTEPQNVHCDWEISCAPKSNEKSDLTVLIKKGIAARKLLNLPPSDDIPAELIVSITSAKQTVTDESLDAISTVSAIKHNEFDLPGFSAAKFQAARVDSLNDENVKIVNGDCTNVTNLTKTKWRKLSRQHSACQKKASKSVTETLSLQRVKTPVEDNISNQAEESSGLPQMSNSSNIGWRKLRRRKRKYGKLSSKNKKLRSSPVGVVSESRQQSVESPMSMEIEVCAMRKKTERWDLKPLVSECGRILVPHGSVDFADQIKLLKDKISKQSTNEKMFVNAHDTTVTVHDTIEMEQESSTAPQTVEDNTEATTFKDGANIFPNVVFNDVNFKGSLLRQSDSDDGSLPLNLVSTEYSSESDSNDSCSSESVIKKHTENLFQGKCATKGGFLFSKLKSVLLRGKRKANVHVSEGMTTHGAHDTEPSVKKNKVDSDTGSLKCNNAIGTVQENVKKVSEMLSLDPLFAYALGLTPKEKENKAQENVDQNIQISKDSEETLEQFMLEKQPQNIQRPPVIYPRKGRIKTLRNHQGIPAEYIKRKWWLHFQSPTSFARDRLKNKECTSDNSVRKTVKEKMNSACTSTDGLNLLADLALSASNGQVLQQPDPSLERKPETSFKMCDITKDVTSAEQESVLHTLLTQRAARPIRALESTSPSHLAAETELLDLISEEHAYSLPPSSSLLLGLPGTPFHVSPISGSTRLLHRHQQFSGNGIQTLHPSVCREDRDNHNNRTSEYLKKHGGYGQIFRHYRTCVNKGGAIQVTRQWKDNYDFNLDSKFTSDPKDKTIIRALHGPWDFSIQDTTKEIRLIVHMWIGLFYSRSTARFFQMDSNFTYPCSSENEPWEMFSEMALAPAESELKDSPFAPFPGVTDPSDSKMSKALDLSKKDTSVLDHKAVILDLSLKNSNAETVSITQQVSRKKPVSSEKKEAMETFNPLRSFMELHEASTFQCYRKMVQTKDDISKRNGARSRSEVFLYGYTKEKAERKNETDSHSTEISSVPKGTKISSKSVTDKYSESSKEAEEEGQTLDHEETLSKDEANLEIKENLFKDGNIDLSKATNSDDSTNKEPSIDSNGSCLENDELFSSEIPKAFSSSQTENVNEDGNYCTAKEGTAIKEKNGFGKEPGLEGEKDSCISSVEAVNDLRDGPVPVICDSSDLIKDSITDGSHQAPFDEQPSQADSEERACHDLRLRHLSGDGSSLTDTTSKTPETLSEMEPVCCEPVTQKHLERDICWADKAGYQKAALPTSDENICSLLGSCTAVCVPQTKDNVEPESQNLKMTNVRFGLRGVQESNSSEGDEKDDVTVEKEQCHDGSHSLQCEAIKINEAEEAFTKETLLKMEKTNEAFGKNHNRVVPFTELDIYGENIVHPLDVSQQKVNVEDLSKMQTTYLELPTEECSTFKVNSEKTDVSEGKILVNDLGETNQLLVLESESDDRCPTPTMDEKPYEHIPSISNGFSSNLKPVKDEMPFKPKHYTNKSLVNNKRKSHYALHHDLKLRTHRVLQSIDTFLSKSNHTDKSDQLETNAGNTKQVSNIKSEVVSASTSQELHTNSSEHYHTSPSKSKLEKVLGVRLHSKKSDSEKDSKSQKMSVRHSSECLHETKTNVDQDRLKTSQSGLNLEVRSYSDECQGHCMCKDGQIENSPKSETKTSVVTHTTPTSMENTESVKEISEELNDQTHKSSDHFFESSWLSSVDECKFTSDKAKRTHLDPAHYHLGNDTKFSQSPESSQSMQSLESMNCSSRSVDGSQSHYIHATHSLVEKIGKTATENEECMDASASFVDYKNTRFKDNSLTLGPEASLICTVFNASHQRCSFLEQVSKRCLQDNLTQASMEQEHLIFYEQVKQLLKRSKKGTVCQEERHDTFTSSCTSPVMVHFSSLSEQDDSPDYLDASSLVGQKFKVDMSNRKDLTDVREKEKSLHPQETGNQVEYAGLPNVTEECARLYEAMMNDACSVKKVPFRSKFFGMDRVNKKTHNHFDYCDQMKREMDESFHSSLNSVVKKSCKTKYRFYILITSGDAFFEKTKAELEARGHTAVEPSEFFLHEDSSCLLIVLRNEDIAEHVCEVPHLLELKKSPAVEFAGIDEPDDVVNLTHQELFTQGGFIMFNRVSLESLSLCNMKKCLEILQELSRTGKWKWILHYRDSRHLKEKARLSAEAKQKTHFLNWCQDTGILELLPYHDCDLMSKDQPDYLTCLVHLQVQNVLARFPVFITDTTTDPAFGRNGILTMTVESFLSNSTGKLFTG